MTAILPLCLCFCLGNCPTENDPGGDLAPARPAAAADRLVQRYAQQLGTAEAETAEGLRAARSFTTSLAHFRAAILRLDALRSALARADRSESEATPHDQLASLRHRVDEALVAVLLDAASAEIVHHQPGHALGHVADALAVAPDNAEARAMRRRLEDQANQPILVAELLRRPSRRAGV